MERLTMIDGMGNEELVRCMGCGLEKAGENLENCGFCEEGWQKALKKLYAIEDILGNDYGLDRLRELVEADRDGRCVVLPCKVGDPVYVTNWFGKTKHEIYRIIDPYFYTDDARGFSLKEFGKTVFLTREAAEAELKNRSGGTV